MTEFFTMLGFLAALVGLCLACCGIKTIGLGADLRRLHVRLRNTRWEEFKEFYERLPNFATLRLIYVQLPVLRLFQITFLLTLATEAVAAVVIYRNPANYSSFTLSNLIGPSISLSSVSVEVIVCFVAFIPFLILATVVPIYAHAVRRRQEKLERFYDRNAKKDADNEF